MHRLSLPALALLVLSGCAGAGASADGSYDPATNTTRYRSSPVKLGVSASGGYVTAGALELRAEAECLGEGCAPGSYVLTLSNPGPNDVASDVNQVVFTTPDGAVSFEPGTAAAGATPVTFYNSGRGELVRIELPADIYRSFATARDLSVRIGSQDYRLPYDTRGPLRRLLPAAE